MSSMSKLNNMPYPKGLKEALEEETRQYCIRLQVPIPFEGETNNIRVTFSFTNSSEKWGKTTMERYDFWRRVLWDGDFDYFFEKFPELKRTEVIIDDVKYII